MSNLLLFCTIVLFAAFPRAGHAAADTHPDLDRHSLTVATHPTVGFTNAQADAEFTTDTGLLRTDNNPPTDVGCCVILERSGAVFNLPAPWNAPQYNMITTQADQNDLLNHTVGWVNTDPLNPGIAAFVVVTSLPGSTLGVTFRNHDSILVEHDAPEATWVHEFGHDQGLPHRDATDAIMHTFQAAGQDEVNQTECTAMHDGGNYNGVRIGSCTPPLAVELASFEANVEPGGVTLLWQTESEIDNEGFNVLRSLEPEGDYEVVGISFIPAEGGPAFGASYELLDDTVEPDTTYYYLLEDIDTSGVSTLHGADACTFGSNPDCEPLEISVPAVELSAAEFCATHEISSESKKDRRSEERACKEADWRNNEGRHPHDCMISKGGRGSRETRSCLASADAD